MLDGSERSHAERTPSWRELAGLTVGFLLAPLASLLSRVRKARVFHPVGRTFRARVEANASLDGAWRELSERLSGPALARFSGALWRGGFEGCDVLGVAVRLREDENVGTERVGSDQDLLFATIVSPLTMPLAPFTTNAHDYLANKYWAVSPFDVGQSRHVKFRLSPVDRREQRPAASRGRRDRALTSAVEGARVSLRLEARRTFDLRWQPLATVWLIEPLDIDQEALRFFPFQNGRGIVPCGFVHALRKATYAASQRARPQHAFEP